MVSRRNFLKNIGKAAAIIPIALVAPLSVISAQDLATISELPDLGKPDLSPLSEGVVPEFKVLTSSKADVQVQRPLSSPTIIEPKWMISPVGQPTKEDPLGQWGYVAIKYQIDDKQYGDWMKITDLDLSDDGELILEVAQHSLFKQSQLKAHMIDPNAYLKEPVWNKTRGWI